MKAINQMDDYNVELHHKYWLDKVAAGCGDSEWWAMKDFTKYLITAM